MPRGDQLIRRWRLLQALENRAGQTVEDLALDLKCTVRTIWRDLSVLQAAGFPLADFRDGKRSRCCHLRGEPRTFAVERIRAIRRTGLQFVRPRDFDAEAYFRDSWGIIRGDRDTVRLRFSPGQANYIAERLWHPTQEFQWLSDGRLDLSLKVADTLDLKRWVLGYGREVEVVEPAALREEIRAEAEAVSQNLAPRRRPAIAVTFPDRVRRYKSARARR